MNSGKRKSLQPVANEHSKVLLLGTMPGEVSLFKGQYYAHKNNQFWRLLYVLLEESFSNNYEERLKLLVGHRIALWDVLEYCDRVGSSDSTITAELPNDFETFYRKHPTIKHVFFTSSAAKKYYERLVGLQKGIEFFLLPSPSSAYASKSFEDKLEAWRVILMYIK